MIIYLNEKDDYITINGITVPKYINNEEAWVESVYFYGQEIITQISYYDPEYRNREYSSSGCIRILNNNMIEICFPQEFKNGSVSNLFFKIKPNSQIFAKDIAKMFGVHFIHILDVILNMDCIELPVVTNFGDNITIEHGSLKLIELNGMENRYLMIFHNSQRFMINVYNGNRRGDDSRIYDDSRIVICNYPDKYSRFDSCSSFQIDHYSKNFNIEMLIKPNSTITAENMETLLNIVSYPFKKTKMSINDINALEKMDFINWKSVNVLWDSVDSEKKIEIHNGSLKVISMCKARDCGVYDRYLIIIHDNECYTIQGRNSEIFISYNEKEIKVEPSRLNEQGILELMKELKNKI